jgi:hypothetical protein
MRHHQDDSRLDDGGSQSDLTTQFWGATRNWISREHATIDPLEFDSQRSDRDPTGSLRAIRDGFASFRPSVRRDATGEIERTRQHGVVHHVPPIAPARDATLGELASGWTADDDDPLPVRRAVLPAGSPEEPTARQPVSRAAEGIDAGEPWWDDATADDVHAHDVDAFVPLTSTTSGRVGFDAVDPLLVRFGVLVLALLLLVPLALSLRSSDDGAIVTDPGVGVAPAGAAPIVDGAPPASDVVAAQVPGPAVAATDPSAGSPRPSVAAGDPGTVAPTSATPSVNDVIQLETPVTEPVTADESATVSAAAERLLPDCPQTYAAGVGDSWYRIADAAGITMTALLSENRATVETVILPGDVICLPGDAVIPVQPTTTTAAPTTVPATTVPATTLPPAPATTAEAQQIIRDVWPDELEQKALAIAWRESGYVATAYNGWCCYGLFQIYWTVHRSWLADMGITSASDLLDARTNAEAAYELYRRAGGWGPWGG